MNTQTKYHKDFNFFIKNQIGVFTENNGRYLLFFSRLTVKDLILLTDYAK
jgi:hypothetical protein